ncbi:MAG: response regulator [Acetobacteraceae bacterium]|nr:response regulator [Acetobacteraceae bacterium]
MSSPPVAEARAAGPIRVFLVEDSAPVAEVICEMLDFEGISAHGPFGDPDAAREAAGTLEMDLALLDPDLGGIPVWPVADVLARRAIPFAFLTGNEEIALPARFANRPVLGKPFRHEALIAMVRSLAAAARDTRAA